MFNNIFMNNSGQFFSDCKMMTNWLIVNNEWWGAEFTKISPVAAEKERVKYAVIYNNVMVETIFAYLDEGGKI
jgi:hypothetical protein